MTETQIAPMRLRVMRNEPIAEGIHLFDLQDAGGAALPPFTAGAHIAIRTPSGLLRKYSLCGDPADNNRYQVAIKREATGVKPASSNSLTSGGTAAQVWFMASARGRVTRFQANSPLASMLRTESL